LVLGFIEHERLMNDLIRERVEAVAGEAPVAAADLVALFRASHGETKASLGSLTGDQWDAPFRDGVDLWEPVRRSQLMWIALEDLIDQVQHFVEHRRAAHEEQALAGKRESLLQPI
jgi:hypothetical protein